jgi:hypothetical protein
MKTNEELFNFLEELVKELIDSNEKDAQVAAGRIIYCIQTFGLRAQQAIS